jgi:AcrR family transcriptional regulator
MDKKEQITREAMELFAKKGFEGTSIRDIASNAGVNIAMINYYFGSKEKLFESLLENKAAYTRDVLSAIAKDPALTEIEKIEKIIEGYVTRLFTGRVFHRMIHQEMMLSNRDSLQDAIVEMIIPNGLIIKGIIEAGIKKGEFRKVDSTLTMASIVGTINQVLLSKKMCNRLLAKPDDHVPYDDEKFKKRVSDHIKDLMRAHLLK